MQVATEDMAEDGRYWIYATIRKVSEMGFVVDHATNHATRRRIICSDCKCPIPYGHYVIVAHALDKICFECIAADDMFIPGPAPASLEPFWDRGEN